MATTVFSSQTIELLDGTEVTLKPLNIKGLRLFNKKMKELQTPEGSEPLSEDDVLDVLLDLCGVCLSKQVSGGREYLEEALDIETIYKVIEVCGGIKLNDPNLVEAALATMV